MHGGCIISYFKGFVKFCLEFLSEGGIIHAAMASIFTRRYLISELIGGETGFGTTERNKLVSFWNGRAADVRDQDS